jgi:hypothetical protein
MPSGIPLNLAKGIPWGAIKCGKTAHGYLRLSSAIGLAPLRIPVSLIVPTARTGR